MILKHIKNRIQVVNFIKKITETMKIVAASSFKNYEKLLINSSKYLNLLRNNIISLNYNYNSFFNNFPPDKQNSNTLIVVFGNDKSLCGSFNSRILNRVSTLNRNNNKFFFIGKKIYQNMKSKCNKKNILGFAPFFTNKNTKLNIEQAFNLVSIIHVLFKQYNIVNCKVVYSKFYSITNYEVNELQFLPFITPKINYNSFKYHFFEIDNNIKVVANLILKKYLNAIIFNIYCNSIISENAARMLAMENANQNSKKKLKDLKLIYNQSRQNSITRELIEVISGAEGLKQ